MSKIPQYPVSRRTIPDIHSVRSYQMYQRGVGTAVITTLVSSIRVTHRFNNHVAISSDVAGCVIITSGMFHDVKDERVNARIFAREDACRDIVVISYVGYCVGKPYRIRSRAFDRISHCESRGFICKTERNTFIRVFYCVA